MAVHIDERVELLQERMREHEIDLIAVGPSPHMRYLLGRQDLRAAFSAKSALSRAPTSRSAWPARSGELVSIGIDTAME